MVLAMAFAHAQHCVENAYVLVRSVRDGRDMPVLPALCHCTTLLHTHTHTHMHTHTHTHFKSRTVTRLHQCWTFDKQLNGFLTAWDTFVFNILSTSLIFARQTTPTWMWSIHQPTPSPCPLCAVLLSSTRQVTATDQAVSTMHTTFNVQL